MKTRTKPNNVSTGRYAADCAMGFALLAGASPIDETGLTIVEAALMGAFAVGAPKKNETPLLR